MLHQNVDVKIPGLDLSSAFNTADKEQLMQILELILEDEIRMCRFLLSETSTTLRFEKILKDHLKQIKDHHKVMPYMYLLTLHLRMLSDIYMVK